MIWGHHKSWHGDITLEDIDKVTGDIPTIIWQRSTHEIYLNSASVKKYGIKEGDLSPEDDAQADWDNYHFWERAYQMMKGTKLSPFFGDQEMLKRGMERISQLMLQNGITAMAEPSFPNSSFENEYAVLVKGTEKAKAYPIYLIAGFPEQFVKQLSNDVYEKHISSLPEKHNTEYIKFLPGQFKGSVANSCLSENSFFIKTYFYSVSEHCNIFKNAICDSPLIQRSVDPVIREYSTVFFRCEEFTRRLSPQTAISGLEVVDSGDQVGI